VAIEDWDRQRTSAADSLLMHRRREFSSPAVVVKDTVFIYDKGRGAAECLLVRSDLALFHQQVHQVLVLY
jgi:hypothetical protein